MGSCENEFQVHMLKLIGMMTATTYDDAEELVICHRMAWPLAICQLLLVLLLSSATVSWGDPKFD